MTIRECFNRRHNEMRTAEEREIVVTVEKRVYELYTERRRNFPKWTIENNIDIEVKSKTKIILK